MQSRPLAGYQLVVMAAAAGITVANIYYAQPILADIADTFHISKAEVGRFPVLTQAAYGLGLLFLTPLGDMIDRKKLVVVLELLLTLALAAMVAVGNVLELYVVGFLVGLLAVSVQILLPMAAALASPEAKGRTVGTVFTGTLTGILSARVLSGYVAEWLGWRWVYGLSALLVFTSALIVSATLPSVRTHHAGSYGALLRSTLEQFRRFPLLRRATLLGTLVFGTFASFWTTLTFQLSGPPFDFRSDVIGLFGILAVGSAATAPLFGRLADRGHPARVQALTVSFVVAAVLCVQVFPHSLMAFVVATVLLDIGVQATQVINLAQIYGLDETAHSRINTAYVTTLFIGAALGTYAGVLAWSFGGWAAVCWQLLACSSLALAVVVAGAAKAGPGRAAPARDQEPADFDPSPSRLSVPRSSMPKPDRPT